MTEVSAGRNSQKSAVQSIYTVHVVMGLHFESFGRQSLSGQVAHRSEVRAKCRKRPVCTKRDVLKKRICMKRDILKSPAHLLTDIFVVLEIRQMRQTRRVYIKRDQQIRHIHLK